MPIATDHDRRIIDAVSYALDGRIGSDDDVERLRKQIEGGSSTDKLKTACEIAVAFIRWAQDLKDAREPMQYRPTSLTLGGPICDVCKQPIRFFVDLCQIDSRDGTIITVDQHCWRELGSPLTIEKYRAARARHGSHQTAATTAHRAD
jgi:hypothetical protein